MGNEIFYCIGCGSRVSGPDFGGDRSHCARCLGIPVDPTPRSGRESSKRIRKPSSGTLTAVAVRPRPSRALLIGGLSLAGAILLALGALFAPAREKTDSSFSQPPAPQAFPNTPCGFALMREKSEPLYQEKLPKALEELRDTPQRTAPTTVDPEVEALADRRHDEIQEAASYLADEGRFEDALARIDSFPSEYRNTRAWTSLEALRRQIEARARPK
jgi:hypothetical protein